MKAWTYLRAAWGNEMNAADRVRTIFAFAFPFGALGHFGWVAVHGIFYYGPAPAWAVWFWYSLCALDLVVCWLMLTRIRAGVLLGAAVMAFSLWVNWTFFPTFEFGINLVLLGLTAFGLALFALAPWLIKQSRWRWGASAT
jgi:hypothetical protein